MLIFSIAHSDDDAYFYVANEIKFRFFSLLGFHKTYDNKMKNHQNHHQVKSDIIQSVWSFFADGWQTRKITDFGWISNKLYFGAEWILEYCWLVKKKRDDRIPSDLVAYLCVFIGWHRAFSLWAEWKWLLFSIQLTAAIFLNEIDDVSTFCCCRFFTHFDLIPYTQIYAV